VAQRLFDDIDRESRWLESTTKITQIIVCAAGFILMFIGLWVGLKVMSEAWALYQEPQNIERLGLAIEKGSNLDKALASAESAKASQKEGSARAALASSSCVREVNATLGFRLSYFVAWVIGILLLMLVGRLAIAAIKTGGELAFYDLQIKRFAEYLVQQYLVASTRRDGFKFIQPPLPPENSVGKIVASIFE